MHRIGRIAVVCAIALVFQGCFLFKVTKYHAPPNLTASLGADVAVTSLHLPDLELDKKTSRRFMAFAVDHPDVGAVVTRGDATYLLDADLQSVSCRVDLGEDFATGAFGVEGIDAIFLLHHDDGDSFVSRVDPTTCVVGWTSDGGVHTTFTTVATNLMGMHSTLSVEAHRTTYMAHALQGGSEIQLLGLTDVKNDTLNRLVRIDAGSGQVLSDARFHARRNMGMVAEMLVDFDSLSLQLFNRLDGSMLFETQLGSDDLVYDESKVQPVGQWDGIKPSRFFWDVYPMVVGDDLLVSSRHVFHDDIMGGGNFTGHWTRISLDSGQIEESKELKASLDYRIRNFDQTDFPVVMPVFRKHIRARASYAFPIEGMTALSEDGSFTDIPLPEACAGDKKKERCNFFWGLWFHDDGEVFVITEGTLYGVDVVTGQTRTVFVSPDGRKKLPKYFYAPHGAPGYAMLQGTEDATVIRLSDGAEVDPTGLDDLKGTALMRAFTEHDSDLSTAGLPEDTAEYAAGHDSLTDDYLLIPALLQGGGAILVGLDRRELSPSFWFPIGRFQDDTSNDFHYWTTSSGDDLVILAPQEDSSLNVYRMTPK